jgi:hypothetical protein
MNWVDANQRHLAAALADLRAMLTAKLGGEAVPAAPPSAPDPAARPFALDVVTHAFELSRFERALLLLCAAIELDSSFAPLCARLHDDTSRPYPTFSLALGVLPDPHWSALSPAASLRRWKMIDAGGPGVLTAAPLRIDERILHFLAGVNHLDERLAGLLESVPSPGELVPSQEAAAQRIAMVWSDAARRDERPPLLQLAASDGAARRAVAASGCAHVGLSLFAIDAAALPTSTAELETFFRLCERESWLGACALLFDTDSLDTADPVRTEAARQFVDRARAPLLLGVSDRRAIVPRTPSTTIEIARSRPHEQRLLWLDALGDAAGRFNGSIDRVSNQFMLTPAHIRGIAATVRAADDPAHSIWASCRAVSRRHLDELAQRVTATAGWNDLVLPEPQKRILEDLLTCVRFRNRVYEEWGFAARDWRGLSVTALFSGVSGTGKTLAAEVIANELALDLYRIDLSGVVSKYIGETEKNLRRVFDAAEDAGAILLFDEADALFGKRSDVKDSHDRYANIEVGYLLQRMEAYRGVAILTTNARDVLDPAFLRRIRFAVHFPFPGTAERIEIWRKIFPAELPRRDVDALKLARLPVAGGNIRNIAVNAAFGAARDDTPLTMRHLLDAARAEYVKLEKTLSQADVEGWV